MKPKTKSIVVYLPKTIIFGLALCNLLYIRSHLPNGLQFCVVCAWFLESTIDVQIVLAGSFFLLFKQRISYLISLCFSGYVVISGIIFYYRRTMSFLEVWRFVRENQMDIFLQWEIQFILAAIIFLTALIYLAGDLSQANSQPTAELN